MSDICLQANHDDIHIFACLIKFICNLQAELFKIITVGSTALDPSIDIL